MKRRDFLQGVGGALAAGTVLTACGSGDQGSTKSKGAPAVQSTKTWRWDMFTTWPPDFPGLGTGANHLADLIDRMSGGRLKVRVYGANERVAPGEVFGRVADGTAQMGHGAAYYWRDTVEAAQFFAAVPFGLTAQEMNAWLFQGGGLELWQELYDDYGLIPYPAGNTGVQMGGWFNTTVDKPADLEGLKMRIPALGGDVLERLGGTPISLPGGEIYTSLQTGKIDATEWVGPYNDLAFGLHEVAQYYYYPGFHEPGSTVECTINKEAFEGLPTDLQAIVRSACYVANQDMLADFTAKNNQALQTLKTEHDVELRRFPDTVLRQMLQASEAVVAELGDQSQSARRIYDSFRRFRGDVTAWHEIAERAYLNARALDAP
jgi:TRAP-type mannitol/chloroaromatic compound transport system substrate-binding protein